MISDIVRALVAAGASPEMIVAAVEAAERSQIAKQQERLLKQRERTRRWRENAQSVTSRDVTIDVGDVTSHHVTLPPSPDKETSPGPPKEINPNPVFASQTPCAREDTAEFVEFWAAYPNKVGKPDARLKFQKALEKAELPEILAGLHRYVTGRPPDRPWCNPATWLHQERWNDQPAFVATGHAKPNGTGPPKRGSAALSELARRPFEEVFPNVRSFNRS
jgi:hypothetical protein